MSLATPPDSGLTGGIRWQRQVHPEDSGTAFQGMLACPSPLLLSLTFARGATVGIFGCRVKRYMRGCGR